MRSTASLTARLNMFRKKQRLIAVAGLMALSVGATACSDTGGTGTASNGGEDAEPIEIRLSMPVPAETALSQGAQWWADEVEQRTDGQVSVEIFFAGALMPATEVLGALGQGRLDAGFISSAYWPDQLPLWSVAGLPFISDNAPAQMLTLIDLYENNEDFREQFRSRGVHYLMNLPLGIGVMALNKPADNLEDLRGTRARVVGYHAEAFTEVGMEAVATDPTEMYESVQRGVLDGVGTVAFDAIQSLGLHEVTKYVINPGFGVYASSGLGVSLEVWEDLPNDVQEVMTEVAREYMNDVAKTHLDEANDATCGFLLEQSDVEFIIMSPDGSDQLRQVVEDSWREDVEAAGVDEGAVDQFYSGYVDGLAENGADIEFEPGINRCAARQ